MKNITVSIDDKTYHDARVWAAEMNTSVSALVREYLRKLAKTEKDLKEKDDDEPKFNMEWGKNFESEELIGKPKLG